VATLDKIMMTSRPSATHPFLLLRDYIMNKELLEKESYNEQMCEQRANGIPTVSFEEWKRRNKAHAEFFKKWKSAKADAESMAEARCS